MYINLHETYLFYRDSLNVHTYSTYCVSTDNHIEDPTASLKEEIQVLKVQLDACLKRIEALENTVSTLVPNIPFVPSQASNVHNNTPNARNTPDLSNNPFLQVPSKVHNYNNNNPFLSSDSTCTCNYNNPFLPSDSTCNYNNPFLLSDSNNNLFLPSDSCNPVPATSTSPPELSGNPSSSTASTCTPTSIRPSPYA